MPISEDDEKDLKVAVVQADLRLKDRQAFWETPGNLVLIVAAAAGVAGVLGFKIGQKDEGRQPVQIIFQPGSIVAPPAPAPAK